MNRELHFSTGNDEWETPAKLFHHLDSEFHFTLDPCATSENAKVKKYFTKEQNGLYRSWCGEKVFMNPPYSRLAQWMAKAFSAARDDGATVVCLVPSRTDVRWWHRYAMKGEMRFIQGRLQFNNHKNSAPFPSSIVVFRPKYQTFIIDNGDLRPRIQEQLFEWGE
jgi:phage N-6-adenine-methyltransferase